MAKHQPAGAETQLPLPLTAWFPSGDFLVGPREILSFGSDVNLIPEQSLSSAVLFLLPDLRPHQWLFLGHGGHACPIEEQCKVLPEKPQALLEP